MTQRIQVETQSMVQQRTTLQQTEQALMFSRLDV